MPTNFWVLGASVKITVQLPPIKVFINVLPIFFQFACDFLYLFGEMKKLKKWQRS